ncbi:sulfate adenylyltransferase [Geochorda subterranea]|uniref:Sulfate adenylyltransferase n=1 Tax=Geochorda subterranea TaxID=3109564 RepID=A0ABZ1BPW3_9FIRM|nr:sulfate adenylyltransferase [Limnochorda sp. LNt]WRP14749.1 sulfate adenylyltransferase [Limnochorda sp. LNt]
MSLVTPYGGRLVDRTVSGVTAASLRDAARHLPRLPLSGVEEADLRLIACGAYSPLEGFMDRETYACVLSRMTLPSGLPWTVPVVLRVDPARARRLAPGDRVSLCAAGPGPTGDGREDSRRGTGTGALGVLEVRDVFPADPLAEARAVYGTESPQHPAVARLLASPGWCVGGPVRVWATPLLPPWALTPAETRAYFETMGWSRVVGFQTRNPVHRAHEHLQKCALEMVDGLLLHPLVGPTREEDLPAEIRWRACEILVHHYYPPDRVLLSGFAAAMRYAGPREAVFHAVVRRNFGCSHFVVGRDHAGVGSFYGPLDAQRIFDRLDPALLGVEVLRFGAASYCRRCRSMVTDKSCPHPPAIRVSLSGTELRRRLREGRGLPSELARPEVAAFLLRLAQKRA